VWLHAEFDLSERTAQSFMRAAERFGDKPAQIADLAPSVVALLAAPSTPDAVVEGVLSGEIAPTSTAILQARNTFVPTARQRGMLPSEGIGERVLRAFASNRDQRRIASYLTRLLTALGELYDLTWEDTNEVAVACRAAWKADAIPERAHQLGEAASALLEVAVSLGYTPDVRG
jgi:hypothetical protein